MNSFETIASRYEALLSISDMLQEHQHLEELLRDLPETISRVVEFGHLSMMLMRPLTNKPYWYVLPNGGPRSLKLKCELPVEQEWLLWSYKHQQATVIPDQAFECRRDWLRDRELELGYAVPLTAADRRIGAIFLGRTHETGVPDDEARFLQALARRIALPTDPPVLFDDSPAGGVTAAA